MRSFEKRRWWQIVVLAFFAALTLACAVFLTGCTNDGPPDGNGADENEDTTPDSSFSVEVAMRPFEYVTDGEKVYLTGVKNKYAKEIVVPDCVTDITYAAFADCMFVESLTLPFTSHNLNFFWGGADTDDQRNVCPESLRKIVLADGAADICDFAFV